jgi:hypothetical protein
LLDAHASNTEGFLSICIYVSSTELNRTIFSKQSKSVIETFNLQDIFFEKQTQFSLGNNGLDTPASNTDVFLLRDKCVPSTLLNIPLWSQTDFSTLKHISCSMYF